MNIATQQDPNKAMLIHLATSPPGSPNLSFQQQSAMIAMMGRTSASNHSPTRLSPRQSFSVMSDDIPDLDLGMSATESNATNTSTNATFHFFIVSQSGKTIEMTASFTNTIMELKQKVLEQEGIPLSNQHWMYNGVELEDNRCYNTGSNMEGYGFENDVSIQLLFDL
jgi:hypothetical protein